MANKMKIWTGLTLTILFCAGSVAAVAGVGLLSFSAPQAIKFGGGAQTRGINMWAPFGVVSSSCLPNNCYLASEVTTYLPSAKRTVVYQANIGHIRQGLDVTPFLVSPATTATMLPQAFAQFDAWMATGFKVVINNTPSLGGWPGYSAIDVAGGGVNSAKFQQYLAFLAAQANYILANIKTYPPDRVAISVWNEMPSAASVTGGATEIYNQLKAMFRVVRDILPNHTIIVCFANFCDVQALASFNGWRADDFDANTLVDIHSYNPPVAAWACYTSSWWRDVCNVTYPPTVSAGNYNTAASAYMTALAADNTWAGDCPAGSSCVAARAANSAAITGDYAYEGLKCYYGQSPGTFPCLSGQAQDTSWLAHWFELVTTWRTTKVDGVWRANQVYLGEFGGSGTSDNGTGLSASAQAQLLGDVASIVTNLGWSFAAMEVNYSANSFAGSSFGLFNQNAPYSTINSTAINALQFNGQ